jgi:hypothetical protein
LGSGAVAPPSSSGDHRTGDDILRERTERKRRDERKFVSKKNEKKSD